MVSKANELDHSHCRKSVEFCLKTQVMSLFPKAWGSLQNKTKIVVGTLDVPTFNIYT